MLIVRYLIVVEILKIAIVLSKVNKNHDHKTAMNCSNPAIWSVGTAAVGRPRNCCCSGRDGGGLPTGQQLIENIK